MILQMCEQCALCYYSDHCFLEKIVPLMALMSFVIF